MGEPDADPSSNLSFTQLVFSDYVRYHSQRPPSWYAVITRSLAMTGMAASIILRAQQCLYRSGHIRLAWIMRSVGVVLVGADFAPGMTIGTGLFLPHPVGIVIGQQLRIGNGVMIAQGEIGRAHV